MKLTIKNFGPIKDIEFEPKPFSIFIGPQAEGKSTINKLLFFFLHVRDESTKYFSESILLNENKLNFEALNSGLNKLWHTVFGMTLLEEDFHVEFDYGNKCILEILRGNQTNSTYLLFRFSPEMIARINESYNERRLFFTNTQNSQEFFQNTKAEMAVYMLSLRNIDALREIFGFYDELLYIPAGRSSISIFNKNIGEMTGVQADYLMSKFMEKINRAKPKFEVGTYRDIWATAKIDKDVNRRIYAWYNFILKGFYISDSKKLNAGILVDNNYVPITFASSGQQEVLWILHFLMFILHDGIKTKVFIEEPEAHLFPDAQKALMEFISFIHKKTGSEFYITTHSPYILTSTNNLIYAANVGKTHPDEAGKVVPEDTWLPQEDVAGYFVSGGRMEDIFAKDLGMIKAEMIDNVSETIEEDYGKLYDIQHGNDNK